uniref:Uncharacterized protein n=3 Tax=Rhodnius prolixus TaxID=13249 RepID=T1HH01_RHOPR
MYSKSILLLLTTTVVLVSSGIGRCPTKFSTLKINWNLMHGDWHEYASYGDGTTRLCYKCMKYSISSQEGSLTVNRYYRLKLFNVDGSSLYTVKPLNNSNFMLEGKGGTRSISMWLLGGDYYNYLILWSCEEHFFGMYHTESSWILTEYRTETLTDKMEKDIKSVLNRENIDLS